MNTKNYFSETAGREIDYSYADRYLPNSVWEENLNVAAFLGKLEEFLAADIREAVLLVFPQESMRN